jgi:cytochrome o ubiquinol oxidase subunit III
LFELPLVPVNTTRLLLSSITYGFAILSMQDGKPGLRTDVVGADGLFGLAFIGIELYEFREFVEQGGPAQRFALQVYKVSSGGRS